MEAVAEAFVSREARPVRERLAQVAAQLLHDKMRGWVRHPQREERRGVGGGKRNVLWVKGEGQSLAVGVVGQSRNASMAAVEGEVALPGPPNPAAVARAQNRRLWFLARASLARVKGDVGLKIRVAWAGLTVLLTAVLILLRRGVVEAVERVGERGREVWARRLWERQGDVVLT